MPNFSDSGATGCSKAEDPDIFFPMDERYGTYYKDESSAKKICNTCPYVTECLLYAMTHPDLTGIWGGTTERDRSRLHRRNYYRQ